MPLPLLPFPKLITSRQLIPGDLINNLISMLSGTTTGITALAGGGASAATPKLNSWSNEITTVATAADSIMLPPAKSGLAVMVINSGANSTRVNVALNSGDKMNPGNANFLDQAAGAVAEYICTKDGRWDRFVSS